MTGDLRTDFPQPDESTGLMLWRVTNSWQRAIRAALAPHDLTHVQFVLLAVMTAAERDAPLTQRALADEAGTDPMMTSQVLRTLEKKGLIQRRAHPQDGRARALTPTPEGIAVVNRANTAVEAADHAYFAPLQDDKADFTAALRTLDDAAREPAEEDASKDQRGPHDQGARRDT